MLDNFFTRSFQQVNLLDQTYHMTRSYAAENSFISKRMRTQGNSYACWAFSCATMIRAECRRNIKFLFRNKMISEAMQKDCLDYMSNEQTHTEMRNLLMIILLPKKTHTSGSDQSAFLRAAISRVSLILSNSKLIDSACDQNCVGERRNILIEASLRILLS